MNKLYTVILLCGLSVSCQIDVEKKQLDPKISHGSNFSEQIKNIDFFELQPKYINEQISSSIYLSAQFDYYNCSVDSISTPSVNVHYENRYLYLISEDLRLKDCHFFEYTDIDDLFVKISKPEFRIGHFQDFSILRIPINSRIECIYKMNIILNYVSRFQE